MRLCFTAVFHLMLWTQKRFSISNLILTYFLFWKSIKFKQHLQQPKHERFISFKFKGGVGGSSGLKNLDPSPPDSK